MKFFTRLMLLSGSLLFFMMTATIDISAQVTVKEIKKGNAASTIIAQDKSSLAEGKQKPEIKSVSQQVQIQSSKNSRSISNATVVEKDGKLFVNGKQLTEEQAIRYRKKYPATNKPETELDFLNPHLAVTWQTAFSQNLLL